MKKKNRIGTVFIYLIFIVLCLAILYPFLCVLSVSLSSAEDIKLYGFRVLPKHLDFSAYSYLFRDSKMLWQAYGTTIFVSVVGTAIGCLVTSLYAYAISRTTFRWRGVLSLFVTFTMFFSGGMAAQYITYVKLLNLKNSIWVLILPGAFSAMNTIIMRAYYEKLPYSMIESAKIDGASEYQIFWRMMFPLAKPALATICLTLFVAYWNAYYEAMMYMDTGNYVTIQLLLQRMLEKVDFLKNNASAALMVLAMFTACAKTETPSQEETTAPTETAEPAAPADETPADAPADDNPFAEEVTLHWAFPALQDSFPGFEAINEKLNEITKEKINAKIEFEMIPLGEYTEKMNMKFTAGEEFDICFTGAWNPYLPAVAKGAYAELTQDVLDKYAPDVVADLNSAVWDAIRVNGKLYGIPLQQIYVRQTGIRFNTELLNKYGFDPSTVKTLDDLDEYAATIKASEPDAVVIYNYGHLIYENMVNYLGYDVIVSNTTPGVVYYAAETPVVFNQFESEEFKALCEKMREWNLAGYFPTDAVTGADSVGENDIRAIDTDPAHKPGGDITEGQLRGYDITGIAFGDCAMTTGAVQATITAVSATSKNVERAVAFINLLDSDPEVLNLICHGIEGTDYEFVGDKADGLIKPISDYPGMLSFLVGNVFNEYYTDASQVGTWPETAEINANAQASCILGFAFDSEPVATQIAQCSAVVEEYLPALNCGAVDVDSTLEAFNAALKDAGVEQIIAEMQSQIDAWLATK